MALKRFVLLGIGALGILATTAYGYVFIAGAPQFDPPQARFAPGLKFQMESFESTAMGTTRQYGIILPPGYDTQAPQKYPVIFLLHGGHDDARAYVDKYAIAPILHQLYANRTLPASIVVMPDGNDNRGSSPLFDPQYFDGVNGRLGTLIGAELVQVIKSRYRTLDHPKFWALGGLSSGGWGAFNIGFRHLDHFHILFSHSGYFRDSSGAEK